MAKKYGNESISALHGADRVRLRPGVIFGSDGLEGCEQAFFEILSNSIDEAREGYGKEIKVTAFQNHSICVEDHGRGIPIEFNEKEQRFNWELVFCELYAGGKFNNSDDGTYKFSLGLNGLGTCSTQYASAYMDVNVLRDGKEYTLHFERGENITPNGFQVKKTKSKETGTKITWLPDNQVFTDIDIPAEYFADMIRRQAMINPGIRFILHTEIEPGEFHEDVFFYEHGITDHIQEVLAGHKPISTVYEFSMEKRGQDKDDQPEYPVQMHCAFCFTTSTSCIEHYHNSSWLEHGGSPEKALKAAFTSVLDEFLKKAGKYNKTETPISYQDVCDSLIFISNNFSTKASYENQTKKAVNNKFIKDAMTAVLREQLTIFLTEHKSDADRILAQILINKRSREQAERSKLNIKKKLTGAIGLDNRVQKFVDCRTKDLTRRELYIVEGDSALGSVKQGRDAEFQAIMPVRGKILNCLKADLPTIFKSEIITDLLRVLGCGVEVSAKGSKGLPAFDKKNLRWNKVVICTDADVDGFQIRTLILTMLYRLTPTLIQDGYVYIAETPLYEITSKGKTYFAFDDKEKTVLLKKLKGTLQIQRSKGLGENDPDMMWQTTMNPETRRLIQVTPGDAKEAASMFDLLLGNDLQGRKQYIADHGEEYLDQLDVE